MLSAAVAPKKKEEIEINMRILIVSESIAPFQSVSSIRWTKIAKYIKKKNCKAQITVLTNKKDYEHSATALNPRKKDSLLEQDMAFFDEYHEFAYGSILKCFYKLKKSLNGEKKITKLREARYTTKTSLRKLISASLFHLLYDCKNKLMGKLAWDYLAKTNLDFDVVISSYGPFWPCLAAEQIKKKNPHAIWISDFRDSYAEDSEIPFFYELHKKATMKHCAIADYIFRVNDIMQTFTPTHIPIHMISNGYDPEEKLEPLPPKKFSIVFTGMLYGEWRDIGVVCKAMKELCEEGKLDRDDTEVSYAGSDGELAKTLAKTYGAEEFIHDYGVIPRQEALKMQQYAAILLQMNWNTKMVACLWSGKMYEYMMAQKPIIYVVTGDEPYSEPSKYIHYLGGYCYEQCRHEETYQGMKDYILEKYQEWKTTGNVTVKQDQEYIEQFAYPHIAEQVWQLIQEGMRKRNESGIVKEN